MFERPLPLSLAFVAALSLVSCASQPAAVAAADVVKPLPPWSATHYKVGARLYPRCMKVQTTGSLLNSKTYCMTEEQIASIDGVQHSMKIDLEQRSAILPISIQ